MLSTIAHADDHLLFQSPRVLSDLTNGDCFTTIVLTAGESEVGIEYALEREAGTEAAVAGILGVTNEWVGKVVTLGGQPVVVKTLVANSKISTVWMRLPDGFVALLLRVMYTDLMYSAADSRAQTDTSQLISPRFRNSPPVQSPPSAQSTVNRPSRSPRSTRLFEKLFSSPIPPS